LADTSYHSQPHGGARNFKFSPEDYPKIHTTIFDFIKDHPDATQREIVEHVAEAGWQINSMFVSRLFARWGFTRKKKLRKQIGKFHLNNLIYYAEFLVEVKKIPWSRLKFLDESSFNSRDIRRHMSYGLKGHAQLVPDKESIQRADSETYTVTLLTSLANNNAPFAFYMKEGTNNQWDFLEQIADFIELGDLVCGDTLVCDNCGIHGALDTLDPLLELLSAAGVNLIFLPTYSPELNPCELVFAEVKNALRNNRGNGSFDREILYAFSQVTTPGMFLMYMQCIWMDFLDPPLF